MTQAPARTLGVLGGMGPAATAEFLRLLALMAPARRDQEHPRIIVLSDPGIPDRTEAFLRGGDDPSQRLREGLDRLASWGADLLAVPCNTAHIFIDRFRGELSRPLVHIVSATMGEVCRRSPAGAWLLATGATRVSGLYGNWARDRGYPLHVPPDEVQDGLSEVIRCVKANRMDESAAILGGIVGKLWEERPLPLVLACTELPLAYDATGLPAGKAVSSLHALASACLGELYEDVSDTGDVPRKEFTENE